MANAASPISNTALFCEKLPGVLTTQSTAQLAEENARSKNLSKLCHRPRTRPAPPLSEGVRISHCCKQTQNINKDSGVFLTTTNVFEFL